MRKFQNTKTTARKQNRKLQILTKPVSRQNFKKRRLITSTYQLRHKHRSNSLVRNRLLKNMLNVRLRSAIYKWRSIHKTKVYRHITKRYTSPRQIPQAKTLLTKKRAKRVFNLTQKLITYRQSALVKLPWKSTSTTHTSSLVRKTALTNLRGPKTRLSLTPLTLHKRLNARHVKLYTRLLNKTNWRQSDQPYLHRKQLFFKRQLTLKQKRRFIDRGVSTLYSALYRRRWSTNAALNSYKIPTRSLYLFNNTQLAQIIQTTTTHKYTTQAELLWTIQFLKYPTVSTVWPQLPLTAYTHQLEKLQDPQVTIPGLQSLYTKTTKIPLNLTQLVFPNSSIRPELTQPLQNQINLTSVDEIKPQSISEYKRDQLFYNSMQSYLVYYNSLRQHLATSPSASLILSSETRATRLSTLPVFLELTPRPFGIHIKFPAADYNSTKLANAQQKYVYSFLTPMFTKSWAAWRLKKHYTPKPARSTVIKDNQLRLTGIGPKPKPILGLQPNVVSELQTYYPNKYTKYKSSLLIASSYLRLIKYHHKPNKQHLKPIPQTKRYYFRTFSKLLLKLGYFRPQLKLVQHRVLDLVQRRYPTWLTKKNTTLQTKLKRLLSEDLLNNVHSRYTYTKQTHRLREATRNLCSQARFRQPTHFNPKTPQYRYHLRLYRLRTRKVLQIKKRRSRILRKSTQFFYSLRYKVGLYQRRLHFNFSRKQLPTDFYQTRITPDALLPRPSLTGIKGVLTHRRTSRIFRGAQTSNTFVRIFTPQNILNYSHSQLLLWIFLNPFLLKLLVHSSSVQRKGLARKEYPNYPSWDVLTTFTHLIQFVLYKLQPRNRILNHDAIQRLYSHSNLLPHRILHSTITKHISSSHLHTKIREDFIPLYFHTLIRFVEAATGRRFLFQFYPFLHQNIPLMILIRYKQWIPKMKMYERRLGHKFFFEESLHIMHLSFALRDAVLFSTWLKIMIRRISFWKTRLIFRFLRYLFINFFSTLLPQLKIKGLKIKLKGKISVGGNSRKRVIYFRSGETSYSRVDLRVVHHKQTIGTFTGVQGLQLWIFY